MKFVSNLQKLLKGKTIQKSLLLHYTRDKKAFSLVEILVAMIIIVIVFVSGFLIFSNIALRISRQTAQKTILASASDFTLFLRHKLKEAIIQDIEGPFRIDFVGTETSIKFVAPYTEGKGSDLGKYGIYFVGNEIKLAFERIERKTKTYSFEPGFSGSQVLIENVKKLKFSYYDGESWGKSWDTSTQTGKAELPKKIKVFFVLSGGNVEGKEIDRAFNEEIWMGK
ncbi:MAG: GspJ family type II secretion system protein [Candidatus Omnitrophica bacterium]|nr:GspJ family type II secretion system protein [Candidatus Omnitrophota bacterium]